MGRLKRYRTPEQWKEQAKTFSTRRAIAEWNLDTMPDGDRYGYQMVEADLRRFGIPPDRCTPFGPADVSNQFSLHGWRAMRLHMWTRKELWSRLRWLKAEVSRLMIKPVSSDGIAKRDAALAKRRAQVTKYTLALDEYAPLHKALADMKRNRKKRVSRTKSKKLQRAAEIKEALGKLGKSPKKVTKRIYTSYSQYLQTQEKSEDDSVPHSSVKPS